MRPAYAFLGGALGGLALIILASAACGEDERPPASNVGGTPPGTSSGGSIEAGALHDAGLDGEASTFDASMCQTAPLGAPVQVIERHVEAPPPRGGTLQQGTFLLSESYTFRPRPPDAGEDQPTAVPTGITRQKTVVVADDMIAIVASEGTVGGSAGAPVATAGTYVVQGTNLSISIACPSSAELTLGYTADEQGLVLFGADGSVDIYRLID